ncbi:MAG: thiamine pyrophosphate-dependent enzyme [Methanomicrobiales archaeon]
MDTHICMGASITVASGIAHHWEPRDVLYTIGDSTFLHTRIQGLLNAAYNGANITVVILKNRITAMTGHHPTQTPALLHEESRATRLTRCDVPCLRRPFR